MASVDDLHNAEEAVDQLREEAARAESERLRRELAEPALAATADLNHRSLAVPLTHLRPMINTRRSLPHVEEMARSIKELGLLHPLLVAPRPEESGTYLVVAGGRRLAALGLLYPDGRHVVRCQLVEGADEVELIEMQFAENIREPLEPLEYARAARRLMQLRPDWSAADVARRQGLKPDWLRRHLRLLDLPATVVERLESGDLSFTVAELLRRGHDRGELSTDEVEQLAASAAEGEIGTAEVRAAAGYVPPPPDNYEQLSRQLDEARWDRQRGDRVETMNEPSLGDDEEDAGDQEVLSEPQAATRPALAPTPAAAGPARRLTLSNDEAMSYLLSRLILLPDAGNLRATLSRHEASFTHLLAASDQRRQELLKSLAECLLEVDPRPPTELLDEG